MNISALERAPVEIWSSIFAILLQTPLLPQHDAKFAQHMSVFSYECNSHVMACDLYRIACRLRLVCRAWNEMVLWSRPTVVFCSLDPSYTNFLPAHILPGLLQDGDMRPELLKAERLEIWTPFTCPFGDECRSFILRSSVQKIRENREEDEILPFGDWRSKLVFLRKANPGVPIKDLTRVKAFIPGPHLFSESPIPLFDRLPNLEILSWTSTWNHSFFGTMIHHKVHRNLTHLEISVQPRQIHALESPVDFTNLRFLSLYVWDNGPIAQEPLDNLDLATWANFPKLEGLYLTLSVQENIWYDEILSFLNSIGAKLSSLVLGGPRLSDFLCGTDQNSTWRFTTETWSLFPSLLNFGLQHNVITRCPPPPPITMQPPTLMYRFLGSVLPRYLPSGAATDKRNFKLLDEVGRACEQWRTKQMTMYETWKDAEAQMLGPISLQSHLMVGGHVGFYERLIALGVEIRDRDGTLITEPAGTNFLQALKAYESKCLFAEANRDSDEGEEW